jgi:hypothetical protein
MKAMKVTVIGAATKAMKVATGAAARATKVMKAVTAAAARATKVTTTSPSVRLA